MHFRSLFEFIDPCEKILDDLFLLANFAPKELPRNRIKCLNRLARARFFLALSLEILDLLILVDDGESERLVALGNARKLSLGFDRSGLSRFQLSAGIIPENRKADED